MKKSLTKQTIGGFLWMGGVKASNAILQFGILAILARLLSPTEFGLMGLALVVISFSDIFTDLGFGPAITQKKELSRTDIHTGFTFSIIFGILLFVILWVLSPIIAIFFKNEKLSTILKAISVVLFLRSIITIPLGLMYRNMQFKRLSLIQIISYAIGYGAVGIILAFLGFGVWSLVIAVISQSVLSLILYLIYGKEALGVSFNKQSFKSLLRFGGGYSLSKIFTYAGNKGDKIVIGRVLGVDALGLYERGYQIVKFTASLIGEIIDKVLFSPIARKQDNRELVGKVFLELTYILAVIFFPLSSFIYNNAKSIVFILLGDQWENTIDIVKIMSVSIFFLISTRVGATVAKSLGDVYRRAVRSFIYCVFVVVGTYFATRWGIDGVAMAVTGAVIINYLLAFAQINKLTQVSLFKFIRVHFLGILLSGLFQGGYCLIVTKDQSPMSFLGQLIISSLILFFVYFVGYFLGFRETVIKYLNLLKQNKG